MRIYIGNCSYETSEEDLRQAFQAYGQIEEVTLVKDRYTGRSKGFAFVEMPVAQEATAAITALNGKDIGGRKLTINEARPRAERRSEGMGRTGGSGGRMGGDSWDSAGRDGWRGR
ncbi:MAG: RNA-binding protein [Chloroflexi bacterium]|nr:RNA-binding protein [Chloroflexota bacterium]